VNADGGWGYVRGNTSRLEPTCWALLALLDTGSEPADRKERVLAALAALAARQDKTGLLIDVPGALPNFAFNGLAATVIRRAMVLRSPAPARRTPDLNALVSAILAGEGVRFGRTWINRQDNRLSGWPWHGGTSNWVEPTAWCAIALKTNATAAGPLAADRLTQADRLLADRCCLSGGWNYGNSNMLGKELPPYVPSSAVALLALQDRRALPEVARSINWLAANWYTEPSAGALSLAMIAIRVFGRSADGLERALGAHLADADSPGNLAVCGLTCYALGGRHHGYAAFTL
jgi:hypothetical protein